jgi:hypothetical protein
MKGYVSEQALAAYAQLVAEAQGLNFSEGETYDFTRCVKPNGKAYGTSGKCRLGSEEKKQEDQKPQGSKKHVGKSRLEQYILDETLNKLSDDEKERFKNMSPEQQRAMGTALIKEMAKDSKFWGALGHSLVSNMFGR